MGECVVVGRVPVRGGQIRFLGLASMLAGLLLYNLLLFATVRDGAYLVYVLFVTAMATAQAALTGLGYQYAWPEQQWWNSVAPPAGMCLAAVFGLFFARSFLESRHAMPRLDKVLLALAAGWLVALSTALALPYHVSSWLVSVLAPISVTAAGVTAQSVDPFTVTAPASVVLSAQPAAATVRAGQAAGYTIVLARTAFTAPVDLAVAGLPAGLVPNGSATSASRCRRTAAGVMASCSARAAAVAGPRSRIARATRRPMRPKPLIATFVIGCLFESCG